jgi:hypothetical protein
MTISSTTRVAGPFTGNGTASAFPFAFKVFAASDLKVVRLNTTTVVETVLVLNSDYTVTLNGNQNTNPGGTVTLVAGPLATGQNLVITTALPNLQPTDLTNQGGFYPEVINDALDRATMQIQQIQEGLDRSVKVPVTQPVSMDQLLADIVTVAADITNVDTVAGSIANVNTVGTNIADVNTVASDIADVITVAADLNEPVSEIETVAASIVNVNTVGTAISNVNTVATSIADVNTVAADLNEPVSEIETVAASITNVDTVGTNIASVNTTATNIASVNTTATNIASVNTVSTNIASVNSAATNMAAIIAAPTEAANAAASAAAALAAETGAENARDAALIQAGVYVDEATGRAAVADGEAFKVQGTGNVAAFEYRRVNASTSTLIATYPSIQYFDTVWQRHVNVAITISGGLSEYTVAGNNVTVATSGNVWLVNGKQTNTVVPALTSTTIGNQQCLCLDISTIASPVWASPQSLSNVKDDPTKIIVFINLSGRLFSPLAAVQRVIADVDAQNPIWRRHVNIGLTNVVTVSAIAGNDVTFSATSGFLVNGTNGHLSVPALSSTTLANVNCICLDITNISSPTWLSAQSLANVKNDQNRIIVFVNIVGRLFSPIPSIQSSIDRALDAYNKVRAVDLFQKRIDATIAPNSGIPKPVISLISGNNVTFTVPSYWYLDFNLTFKLVPALTSTTLSNTQCLFLNIANTDSITWSAPSGISGRKNNQDQLVMIVNFYGRLFSPCPYMQSVLDDAHAKYAEPPPYTTVNVTVAPSGGDYTTITDAIAAITDATQYKQYFVLVEDGSYTENGPSNKGLVLKDYVHIIGAGRDKVTIRGPEATPGNESQKDTINQPANCLVQGLTIEAYKNKYPVHLDGGLGFNETFTLRSCRLKHYGGADGFSLDIGIGLYQNQILNIIDCELLGTGIFIHGAAGSRAANTTGSLNIVGCSMRDLEVHDFLEYTKNTIRVHGSRIDEISFRARNTYYNNNPTDPLFNRGYYNVSYDFEFVGSEIGRMTYFDSFTLDTVLAGKRHAIPATVERAINAGSGSIAAGKAVLRLAPPGTVPNTYPTNALLQNNVDVYVGSGQFAGIALDTMAVGANGCIQVAGIPPATVNATSAAIVWGDALEANASGELVKHSTGRIVAYARGSRSSGTGTINVQLA